MSRDIGVQLMKVLPSSAKATLTKIADTRHLMLLGLNMSSLN